MDRIPLHDGPIRFNRLNQNRDRDLLERDNRFEREGFVRNPRNN